MLKPVVTLLATALLAGCGAHPVPLAAARAAAPAAAKAVTATITVLDATIEEGPTPHPGHDYPVTESFSLTLTQDGQPFQLHVFAENPNGTLFVPKVTEVTRGFLQVPRAEWAALGKQLQAAQVAPGSAAETAVRKQAASRAGMLLVAAR